MMTGVSETDIEDVDFSRVRRDCQPACFELRAVAKDGHIYTMEMGKPQVFALLAQMENALSQDFVLPRRVSRGG